MKDLKKENEELKKELDYLKTLIRKAGICMIAMPNIRKELDRYIVEGSQFKYIADEVKQAREWKESAESKTRRLSE